MVDTNDNGAVLADELIGWFLRELPYTDWLKDEYVKWDDDEITATLNIDFDALYQDYFGMPYNRVLEKEPVSFYETGLLVLLAWDRLVEERFRDAFVDEINLKLKYFEAPVRLTQHGRFHEVIPDMADYEDARVYKGPKKEVVVALLICIMLLLVLLNMFVFCSDPFVAPWDKIP